MEEKESILKKFVSFIKKLFVGEKPKQIAEAEEETITKNEKESSFLDEIKVYKEENPELIKLQNQFEKNEIDLSAMTDEQVHELNLLYKRQVADLKKKLENKKTELGMMKQKLGITSVNG